MKRKLRSIVGSIIIGGVLLSGISIALADDTGANTSTDQKPALTQPGGPGGPGGPRHMNPGGMQNLSEEVIANLVEEGIITQDIADEMTSFIEEKDVERKAEMEKVQSMTEEERKAYFESQKDSKSEGKGGFMAEMVEEGILTQDQADAIKEYLEEQAQEKREEEQKEQLDSYVDEGLITEDQEEAIIAYYKDEEEDRKAEMEKVKDMTEEERKAYFESKKSAKSEDAKPGERPDRMKALVDAGILTQDEADAINEYEQEQMQEKMAEEQAKRDEEQKEKLDSLVDDGTITEDQADAILAYLEEEQEEREAEREKMKDMTEEERKTYFENKKDTKSEEKPSPLKELVDDGTLTQEEADAVVKALFQQGSGAGGPGGPGMGAPNK